MSKGKSMLGWLLRAVVSCTVLALIFWLLPIEDVWRAIRSVTPGLWCLAVMLFLLGHGVAALKWWLLTNREGDIFFGPALEAHFAGLAANMCLPGVAGGDVLRAGLVLRKSKNKTRVVMGSLTDRVLDIVGLLILSIAGAWVSANAGAGTLEPMWGIGLLLLLIAVLATSAGLLIPKLPLTGPLRLASDKFGSVMNEFTRQPGRLGFCLILSVAVQASFVGLNIALAEAAGVRISAAAWFFAWPLAKIVAAVPISLAGLGIREASLAAFLMPLGGNAAEIVAVGLLWQTILLVSGALSAVALTCIQWMRVSGGESFALGSLFRADGDSDGSAGGDRIG